MKHVMVDMETLGNVSDAAIISIGAVRFDLDSDEIDDAGFYASVSIESNLALGRRIQEDTLIWWLKQPSAAQQVFHEPKQTLTSALAEFADWMPPDAMLWSNGADFDNAMLAHAYVQQSMERPWLFWNSRCVRTYKGLPGAKNVSVPRISTHHNALHDALYQAQLVQAIHKTLKGKKVAA